MKKLLSAMMHAKKTTAAMCTAVNLPQQRIGNGFHLVEILFVMPNCDNTTKHYSLHSIAQGDCVYALAAAHFIEIRSEPSDNNNWNGMCIGCFTSIKINLGEILTHLNIVFL